MELLSLGNFYTPAIKIFWTPFLSPPIRPCVDSTKPQPPQFPPVLLISVGSSNSPSSFSPSLMNPGAKIHFCFFPHAPSQFEQMMFHNFTSVANPFVLKTLILSNMFNLLIIKIQMTLKEKSNVYTSLK